MAPGPVKSWALASGAALLVLTAALNLDFCARPETPETGAVDRALAARAPVGRALRPAPSPPTEGLRPAAPTPSPDQEQGPGAPGAYTLADVLGAALAHDFPELSLSPGELEDLAAALAEIEQSVRGIRALGQGAGDGGALAELKARREQALWEFERIAGMPLTEFLRRAPAEGGIDTGEDDDEEIILEPLSDSQSEPAR